MLRKNAVASLGGQDAAYTVVNGSFGKLPGVDGGYQIFHYGVNVGDTQQHITAGGNGGNGGLGIGVVIGDGTHIQGIGDDDAVISQLLPQYAGDDGIGKAGRGIRVDLRHRHVPYHNHWGTGINGSLEGF